MHAYMHFVYTTDAVKASIQISQRVPFALSVHLATSVLALPVTLSGVVKGPTLFLGRQLVPNALQASVV